MKRLVMNSRIDINSAVTFVGLILLFACMAMASPASTAWAQAEGEKAAAAKKADVPETTEVGGEIPEEFLGRWVAFAAVKLPSGALRHFSRLWEVKKGPEHLELVLKRSELPTVINTRMEDATKEGKPFAPTTEELTIIKDTWDLIPSNKVDLTKIENKLFAADAYPEEFNRDVVTKGSDHAFVFNEVFNGKASVLRTYSIYAVRERKPDELKGTFITTSTALAPFPIPITLKGEFTAYRAGEPPPPPSFLDNVMKIFSGCGS